MRWQVSVTILYIAKEKKSNYNFIPIFNNPVFSFLGRKTTINNHLNTAKHTLEQH